MDLTGFNVAGIPDEDDPQAAGQPADNSFDAKLRRIEETMAKMGHPITRTSRDRTDEEQADLYAQGRGNPGPIVTQADGRVRRSAHQIDPKTGRSSAVDFAFLVNGQPSWDDKLPWDQLGYAVLNEGLEWGGNFKSLNDRPHVQEPRTGARAARGAGQAPAASSLFGPQGRRLSTEDALPSRVDTAAMTAAPQALDLSGFNVQGIPDEIDAQAASKQATIPRKDPATEIAAVGFNVSDIPEEGSPLPPRKPGEARIQSVTPEARASGGWRGLVEHPVGWLMDAAGGAKDYLATLVSSAPISETTRVPILSQEGEKLIPFMGSVAQAARLAEVLDAARRVKAGTGSKADEQIISEFAEGDARPGSETARGFGYDFAQMTAQQIPFWIEFAATSGAYGWGKEATAKGIETGAKKLIGQAAESLLKKRAVQAGKTLASATVGAIAQTAAQAPRVAEGTIKRQIDAVLNDQDDGFWPAFAKAFPDTFVEIGSERTGFIFEEKLMPWLKATKVGQRATALKTAIMDRWMKIHPSAGLAGFAARVKDATAWNGILGEISEEYIGDVMKVAMPGVLHDPSSDQAPLIRTVTGAQPAGQPQVANPRLQALSDLGHDFAMMAASFAMPGLAKGALTLATARRETHQPESGTPPPADLSGFNLAGIPEEGAAAAVGETKIQPPAAPTDLPLNPSGQPAAPAGQPTARQQAVEAIRADSQRKIFELEMQQREAARAGDWTTATQRAEDILAVRTEASAAERNVPADVAPTTGTNVPELGTTPIRAESGQPLADLPLQPVVAPTITPKRTGQPDEAKELETIKRVTADWPATLAAVEAHVGNVLNTDDVSEFLGVHSETERWAHQQAVISSAQAIVRALYDKKMAEPVNPDKPFVVITGGGQGSGKSEGVERDPRVDVTLDWPMRNFEASKYYIDKAIASGRKVILSFTYRNPIRAFTHGVVTRLIDPKNGRPVPVEDFITGHQQAPQVLQQLAAHYADQIESGQIAPGDVRIEVDENIRRGNPVTRDLPWLAKTAAEYNEDTDALRETITKHIERLRTKPSTVKRRLTDRQAERLLGRDSAATAREEVQETGQRGEEQPGVPGGRVEAPALSDRDVNELNDDEQDRAIREAAAAPEEIDAAIANAEPDKATAAPAPEAPATAAKNDATRGAAPAPSVADQPSATLTDGLTDDQIRAAKKKDLTDNQLGRRYALDKAAQEAVAAPTVDTSTQVSTSDKAVTSEPSEKEPQTSDADRLKDALREGKGPLSGIADSIADASSQQPAVDFTVENLQKVFGLKIEEAEAAMAIAEAMDLDLEKIKLTSGGTPGEGAMPQPLYQEAEPLESKAFKAWFKQSKATSDKRGTPLRLYSGTRERTPISVFRGKSFPGWFTPDPTLSDVYAGVGGASKFGGMTIPKAAETDRGAVYPVYLSIQNPLDLTDIDLNLSLEMVDNSWKSVADRDRDDYGDDEWADLQDDEDVDTTEAVFNLMRRVDPNLTRDKYEDISDAALKQVKYAGYPDAWMIVHSPEFAAWVESLGYDGILATEGGTEVWAPVRESQIKSATGNQGTYDPNNPNILYQEAETPVNAKALRRWYYSNLSKALESWQNKGTPAQLTAWIKKFPGANEEAQAIGLLDWLDLEPSEPMHARMWDPVQAEMLRNGKVSRDQAIAYVDQHQIQVQTVEKGEYKDLPGDEDELDDDTNWDVEQIDGVWRVTADGLPAMGRAFPTREAALEHIERPEEPIPPSTKYAQYQLPGGSNYREVLLTLPADPKGPPFDAVHQHKEHNGYHWYEANAEGERIFGWDEGEPTVATDRYTTQEAARAAAAAWYEGHHLPRRDQGTFTSGHWDEPNVLAHIRLNDRFIPAADGPSTTKVMTRDPNDDNVMLNTPTKGRRVLFVEEIQSDWHQRGRKHGYDDGKADAQINALENEAAALRPLQKAEHDGSRLVEIDKEISRLRLGRGNVVPDAPFKGSGWKKLALKRVLALAAEGGYDAVAWTTGTQQNERYKLSHKVRRLGWRTPNEYAEAHRRGAAKIVEISTHDGPNIDFWINTDGKVIDQPVGGNAASFVGQQLDAVIGKDVAERILKEDNGDLQGENLDLGGRGMVGFYDKELPNLANDLVKKYGGKVGKIGLTAIELPYKVYRDNSDHEDMADTLLSSFRTQEEAYREVARLGPGHNMSMNASPAHRVEKDLSDDVHFLALPQALREDLVDKGLPLFDGEKAAMWIAQGGEAMIWAGKQPDVSSVAHELFHVLDLTVLDPNLSAEQRGGITDEELKAFDDWRGMDRSKSRAENKLAYEKGARGFEKYLWSGKAPIEALQPLFDKLAAFLQEIYRNIKGSSIDIELTPAAKTVYAKIMARKATREAAEHQDFVNFVAEEQRKGREEAAKPKTYWMNEGEIDEAVEAFKNDPVLGPAARFLEAFKDQVNAKSDGWAYWRQPSKASGALQALIHGHLRAGMGAYPVLPKATAQDVLDTMGPIKAFMTRRGTKAGMTMPALDLQVEKKPAPPKTKKPVTPQLPPPAGTYPGLPTFVTAPHAKKPEALPGLSLAVMKNADVIKLLDGDRKAEAVTEIQRRVKAISDALAIEDKVAGKAKKPESVLVNWRNQVADLVTALDDITPPQTPEEQGFTVEGRVSPRVTGLPPRYDIDKLPINRDDRWRTLRAMAKELGIFDEVAHGETIENAERLVREAIAEGNKTPLGAQITEVDDEIDGLLSDLKASLTGPKANMGVDQESLTIMVKLVRAYIRKGILEFRAVVLRFRADYARVTGDKDVAQFDPWLEQVWEDLQDEKVSVAEALKPEAAEVPSVKAVTDVVSKIAERVDSLEQWPATERALEAGFGTNPSTGVIFYDPRGLSFRAAQVARDGGDWKKWLELGVDEELAHARDLKLASRDVQNAKADAAYVSIPEDVRKAAEELYGAGQIEPWRMLFELVRMKDQLARLNLITEYAKKTPGKAYSTAVATVADWTPTGALAARIKGVTDTADERKVEEGSTHDDELRDADLAGGAAAPAGGRTTPPRGPGVRGAGGVAGGRAGARTAAETESGAGGPDLGVPDTDGGTAAPGGRTPSGRSEGIDAASHADAAATDASPDVKAADARGETPRHFVITDDEALTAGGAVSKLNDNLAALKLLKQLEAEHRPASAEEQLVLSRYVGWGNSQLTAVFELRGVDAIRDPKLKAARQELETILTPKELKSIADSVENAHYSFSALPRAIWSAIERLGFKGGSILEPAVGTGHFLGTMPGAIVAHPRTRITGIDLEPIASGIARQLYQDATIQTSPLEEALVPKGYFDLQVSNVPFSQVGVFDPDFVSAEKKIMAETIHNYYFGKALDDGRPGGLIAFVTSAGTMDSKTNAHRIYIEKRAKFLGAIRLPREAFKKTAGTEVVADIIFLQLYDEGETPDGHGIQWMQTMEREDIGRDRTTNRLLSTNEYFVAHPEMILGTEHNDGKLIGRSYTVHGFDNKLDLDKLQEAIGRLPENVYKASKAGVRKTAKAADLDSKQGSYVLEDGKLMILDQGTLVPSTLTGPDLARALSFIPLRDAYQRNLDALYAQADDAVLEKEQKGLMRAYKAFVKRHGPVNTPANRNIIENDPNGSRVTSLENVATTQAKKGARKEIVVKSLADMFGEWKGEKFVKVKRVIAPPVEPTTSDSPVDALSQSMAWKGHVDLDWMAGLLKQTPDEVAQTLAGEIFQDPITEAWYPKALYLAGDVVTKLAQAEARAKVDQAFAPNAAALKEVQPTPKTIENFTDPGGPRVPFGASYVPIDTYRRFISEVANVPIENIEMQFLNTQSKVEFFLNDFWGQHEYLQQGTALSEWIADTLNGRLPTKYTTIQGERVKDVEKTEEYHESMNQLREQWATWWPADPDAGQQLADIFNAMFNREVPPKFDEVPLVLPNANALVVFRPWQNRVTVRVMLTGNTLVNHAPGGGKTLAAAAIAMEWKRRGLATKILIPVPNPTVEGWRREFMLLYPTAKVLIATKEDFQQANRKRLLARISSNNWDAIVVGHKQFESIPVKTEYARAFIQQQEDELIAAAAEQMSLDIESMTALINASEEADANDDKQPPELSKRNAPASVRDIVRAVKRLRQRLRRRLARDQAGVAPVTFEEMGIDALIVDEAHYFKNLFFSTSKNNIKGLAGSDSDRAIDMFLKVRQINAASKNRNVVFLTGTPLTNTMSEVYTIFRYLAQDELDRLGMAGADAFFNNYAIASSENEPVPGGGYKEVMRLRDWNNLKELSLLAGKFTDTVTIADMVGSGHMTIPKMKGGQVTTIATKPHAEAEQFMASLVHRLEDIKAGHPMIRGFNPKTHKDILDNYLTVTNDAKMFAIDPRLIDQQYARDPNGRIPMAAKKIADVWKASKATKGTQLVFLDTGVADKPPPLPDHILRTKVSDEAIAEAAEEPEVSEEEAALQRAEDELNASDFDLYSELRRELVKRGVPNDEIAYIHQARNPEQMAQLFDAVNAGTIRVFIATRAKGGVGVNVQKKVVHVAHLDVPWRPDMVEQSDARGFRQGNENAEVEKSIFVTEKSFDEFQWGLLATKNKAFAGFWKGEISSMEDIDTNQLSFEIASALATGDPRTLDLLKLEKDVRLLQGRATNFDARQRTAKRLQGQDEARLAYNEKYLDIITEAIPEAETWKAAPTFEITVEVGTRYGGSLSKRYDNNLVIDLSTPEGRADVQAQLEKVLKHGNVWQDTHVATAGPYKITAVPVDVRVGTGEMKTVREWGIKRVVEDTEEVRGVSLQVSVGDGKGVVLGSTPDWTGREKEKAPDYMASLRSYLSLTRLQSMQTQYARVVASVQQDLESGRAVLSKTFKQAGELKDKQKQLQALRIALGMAKVPTLDTSKLANVKDLVEAFSQVYQYQDLGSLTDVEAGERRTKIGTRADDLGVLAQDESQTQALSAAMAKSLAAQMAETKAKPEPDDTDVLYQAAEPIDSTAFKAWFKQSKIVNPDGSPMRVYHGGAAATEFNTPVFLSRHAQVASSYAAGRSGAGAVTPLYASIQKPAKNADVEQAALDLGLLVDGNFDRITNLKADDAAPTYVYLSPSMGEPGWEDKVAKIIAELQKRGFDGAWINGDYSLDENFTEYDSIIAFTPSQVKSATANVGTFDPDNTNILYQDAEPPRTPLTAKQVVALVRKFVKDGLTREQAIEKFHEEVGVGSFKEERAFNSAWTALTGDEAPKRAANINLSKFTGMAQDARRELALVLAENEDYLGQRRGVRTWAETRAVAESIPRTKRVPKAGTAFNAEELDALAGHIITVRERIEDVAAQIAKGQDGTKVLAEQAKLLAQEQVLMETYAGAVAEAGRALNILRKIRQAISTDDLDFLKAAIRAAGGRHHLIKVANALQKFDKNDRIGKYRFIRSLQKAQIADWMSWYWYSNILSGPVTHMRNLGGNSSMLTYSLASKPLAVGIDVLRASVTGTPRTMYLGEIPAQLAGVQRGFVTGIEKALLLLKEGFTMDDVTNLEFRPVEVPGGLWTNIIGRSLEAADVVFRSMRATSELYGRAYADAMHGGLKPGTDAFAASVTEFITRPPLEAIKAMEREAKRSTFREEPGPALRGLAQVRNDWPITLPSGRIVKLWNPFKFAIPFVQTPANIMKMSAEATPFGFLMAPTRQTPRERTESAGRAALGTVLLAPLALMVAQGMVSGAGPDDKELKDQLYRMGWQPNSIRFGDTWYNYQNFQPLAFPLSVLANAYEAWIYSGHTPDVGEIALRTANTVLSASYLSGIAGLQAALEDPDRSAKNYFSRLVNSAAPLSSLRGQVARAIDPIVRRPDSVIENIQAGTPGLSTGVRARVNALGDEAERGGTILTRLFSPVTISEVKDTPLERELYKLRNDVQVGFPLNRVTITDASLNLKGATVQMTADEYATFLKESGQTIKGKLLSRWDMWTNPQLSLKTRVKTVKDIIDDARDTARTKIEATMKARLHGQSPVGAR